MATVNKIRVSVSNGKVARCDGDYTRKATDIRYVVLGADYDISAVGRTRAKPSVLAKEAAADIAINFPYFNEADGALLGHNVIAGAPLTYDTAKTTGRLAFYRGKDGKYAIGDARKLAVDFAVTGSPELLRNKVVVVAESLKRDQLSISANDRSQRTAIGIRADGSAVFVVSDGRLTSDIGLTFEELALVMRDELACVNAINGDGGGSSILYVGGAVVNQRINAANERGTGCAVIAKKAVEPRFMRYTLAEYIEYLQTYKGRVKFSEVHVHATWKPTIAQFRKDGGLKLVEAMARFHTQTNGWSDIAQHVTIDPDGYIWSGRDLLTAPASATNYNDSDNDGIHPFMFEMIGNFDKGAEKLEGAQLRTSLGLSRAIIDIWALAIDKVRFHRDMTNAKTCPGSGVDKAEFIAGVTAYKEADVIAEKTKANVIVNGKKIADGYVESGVTYVPVRAVAEALGAAVAWDKSSATVTINAKSAF